MKLFKTSNIDTVKDCQEFFGFDLPSVLHGPSACKSLKLILLCICLVNEIDKYKANLTSNFRTRLAHRTLGRSKPKNF